MTLKKRLDRLDRGGTEKLTVLITSYETENGEAEAWRAMIVSGTGRNQHLARDTDETEASFRARIDAAKLAWVDQ